MRLTSVQQRALAMVKRNDGGMFHRNAGKSRNFYHVEGRPGDDYVDYRTARVLLDAGLLEMRWERLYITDTGRAYLSQPGSVG